MTQDEIIEMARQAQMPFYWRTGEITYLDKLEAFAKLVAKHTLMNIDPSKFMSYQEGIKAGRTAEREACAKIFDEVMPLVPFAQNDQGGCLICGFTPKLAAKAIRARGQA